jgi:hypothetical protein
MVRIRAAAAIFLCRALAIGEFFAYHAEFGGSERFFFLQT